MAQAHLTYQKTSHRPMTTAHLAQTMSLLEMNNQELAEKIAGELSNNPALELREDLRCPACNRKLINRVCPSCSKPTSLSAQEPIVFVSTRTTFNGNGNGNYVSPESENSFEDFSPIIEDLQAYVLNQIRTELKTEERLIAAHILTSLDEEGLLPTPSVEIAMFHHVPISTIEHVRELIKRSEPYGVGSQTSQEALITQAEILSEQKEIPPHTILLLKEGFEEITQKKFKVLSKSFNLPLSEVTATAKFISENLNPFPAHAHWGDHRNVTEEHLDRYQNPDIIISEQGKQEDPQLVIEVLWPIRGRLEINSAFKKAIADAPSEKSNEWDKDFQKANLLIKCLGQRNHTLVQLMQKIAQIQRKYILEGDLHLIPITRASLAEELDVHESTISRAVNGKSVQLPSGKIVPVAQFFDRSLYIRTFIKQMINEEKEKPISDTKITTILNEQGIDIARRTVAKYRSMEGILPAHLRKKSKTSGK